MSRSLGNSKFRGAIRSQPEKRREYARLAFSSLPPHSTQQKLRVDTYVGKTTFAWTTSLRIAVYTDTQFVSLKGLTNRVEFTRACVRWE